MSRKALLAAGLMVSIGILGGSLTSAQQAPVTVPPGSNPYYLYPVPGVQPVPMLVTPTARFDSPPPTAGISNAGQAGISANNPVNTGVTSTLGPSTMVYTTMQPETVVGAGPAPEASSSGTGRLINDMGPSYYSDVLPAASTVSLGEVAAQFKASKISVNARMLTNEDVGKMVSTQTGVTLAKNMPPLGPSVAGLVIGQPQSAAQSAPPSTQSNASANPQGQSGAVSQPGTPPPDSVGQANAGNATTPQVNQNQQSNDAQGKGRLPATSTLLPLLGLLGAVSGGIGLWFRKFRR